MDEVGSAMLWAASAAGLDRSERGWGSGLLQRGVGELVDNEAASGSVVNAKVIVAGSANGDRLDERAAGDEVQNLPDDLVGPQEVTGEGLAVGQTPSGSLPAGLAIVKVQESDVGELEIGQVGQDIGGQLDLLLGKVVSSDDLSRLVNVVLGGV